MIRKPILGAAILVAPLALLLAWALYNLSALADVNKTSLLVLAEAEIGRKLSVGSLGLSLAGDISIRAKQVILSDDAAFSAEPFARIGELRLTVRFWPLLWRELRIKRILLLQPSVSVIRDGGGQFNVDSLGRRAAPRPESGAEKIQEGAQGTTSASKPRRRLLPPLLAAVRINDGTVRYIDRKRGLDVAIGQVDMALKPADDTGRFVVELKAAILSDKQNSKLTGKVGPVNPAVPLTELPVQALLELQPIDFDVVQRNFPVLVAALPKGLQLRGPVHLRQAEVAGVVRAFSAKATLNADRTEIRWRQDFVKPAGVPLNFACDVNVAQDTVEVRKAELRLRDLHLALDGTIPLRRVGIVKLNFESNRFAAAGWEKVFPALSAYRLSGQVGIMGQVDAERNKYLWRDLDLSFDLPALSFSVPQWQRAIALSQTTLRVRVNRAEQVKTPQALAPRYELAAGEIVVTALAAHANAADRAVRLSGVKSAGEVTLGDAPRYLGDVAANAGKLQTVAFRDLSARLMLSEKIVEIESLKLAALGGKIQTAGEYRFGAAAPVFHLAAHVSGVDIPQFARSVLGAEPKRMRGQLAIETTLSGSGKAWNDIRPTLRGQGSFTLSQGALLDFNLAQQLLTKATGIVGLRSLVPQSVRERYPRIFSARDTAFDELSGSYTLAHELAQLQNVRLAAPDFAARGAGQVDLAGRLEFDGVLLLSRKLSAELTHAVNEVKYLHDKDGRLTLPFKAKGVMPRVEARPDGAAIARALGGGLLQRGLEALRKQIPLSKPGPNEPSEDKEKRPPLEELIRKGLDWLRRR